MIAVNYLTKNFGRLAAVQDVSFQVDKGEIFAFPGLLRTRARLGPTVWLFKSDLGSSRTANICYDWQDPGRRNGFNHSGSDHDSGLPARGVPTR